MNLVGNLLVMQMSKKVCLTSLTIFIVIILILTSCRSCRTMFNNTVKSLLFNTKKFPPINYVGDGAFIDRGEGSRFPRFIVELGEINPSNKLGIDRKFCFSGLPETNFIMNLSSQTIKKPNGEFSSNITFLDDMEQVWNNQHKGKITVTLFENEIMLFERSISLKEFRVGSFCFSIREKFTTTNSKLSFFC